MYHEDSLFSYKNIQRIQLLLSSPTEEKLVRISSSAWIKTHLEES